MRTLAKVYGVPVVLHTDHCAKKILPWVDGVIAAGEEYFARNGEPLFSSHMLDLSEQPLAENIEISARTLTRIAKMNMTLEIELGITGGEEDGVDNSGVEHSKLYTSPEDVLKAYDVAQPDRQLHRRRVVRQHPRRLRRRATSSSSRPSCATRRSTSRSSARPGPIR